MSIIMGPYENRDDGGTTATANHPGSPGGDELFVFGYACKLFRDDDKALLEDSGQLLIPWMGDGSLMVDRYDIRNRLEDKGQFGLKPILPRRRTQEEDELEEALDRERYLAMGVDILEHELLEEESRKRQREQRGGYQAVGFSYKESVAPSVAMPTTSVPAPPSQPEHPSTSSVDVAVSEADRFLLPAGLDIPGHIQQPVTKKLHAIIERTSGFVAKQGTQMEIMIKAKQKYNPLFSFLSLYDPLHSYYRHLLQVIASGQYTPVLPVEGGGDESGDTGEGEEEEVKESDSEESDDEGFELHPLLRVSTTPRSSPKPPGTHTPTNSSAKSSAHSNAPPTTSSDPPVTQSSAFLSKSLSVNAAPSLEHEQWHDHDSYPHPSLESQAYPSEVGGPLYQHPHYQPPAEGYSLHPQPSDFADQSSLEAYYHRVRAEHIQNKMAVTAGAAARGRGGGKTVALPAGRQDPGPPPPPPDLQPVIDKTAEYVARNSEDFERTVLERHCGDPKFGFLNPWNEFYPYYKFRLQMNKQRGPKVSQGADGEQQRRGKNVQKLSQNGSVCFKLEPKKTAMLETDTVSLGPATLEEEEEEEEGSEISSVVAAQQTQVPEVLQPPWQAGRELVMEGVVPQQLEQGTEAVLDHAYSEAHYSAEGVIYNGNGEAVSCQEKEEQQQLSETVLEPPAKRPKRITVMDNKVQEFLSQVKAVLDT